VQLFDNAAYLLFSHPFDVDDDIVLDGEAYVVDYIALPYIDLVRKRDDAFIKISTQRLRQYRIHNVTRCSPLPPSSYKESSSWSFCAHLSIFC
jgi:hypothetical protein